MNLRRAMIAVACLVPFAAGTARAQFQPAAPQQEPPPCIKEFLKLRADFDTKGKALQSAGQRKQKPSAQEACQLFNSLAAAGAKMMKYANENTGAWGCIPANVVQQIKQAQTNINDQRTKICRVAAAPQAAPRGPSLSDALSAPVTDSSNIKTGRGTFDTLTGAPLGR